MTVMPVLLVAAWLRSFPLISNSTTGEDNLPTHLAQKILHKGIKTIGPIVLNLFYNSVQIPEAACFTH